MDAQDYPVEFGFKAQDGDFYGSNGSIGLYHLGEDLYTPTGTQFIVLGLLLGLTGSTGNVGGPHLHVAKWKAGQHSDGYFVARYNRTYYKVTPSIWTAAGVVTELGRESVGDAGKFVRWRGEDGFTYEGFHLSRVDVEVGQVIKGGEMVDDNITKRVYLATQDRDLDSEPKGQQVYDYWRGKPVTELLDQMYQDNELMRYKARHFVEPSASNSAALKLEQIRQIVK